MRMVKIFSLLAFSLALSTPASAGPILDRIKAAGVVRCGGVERPGMVEIEASGEAHGLELDMCRAIASVVLGQNGRIEFTRYDSEKAFAAAKAGHEDVMFLTGAEVVANGLSGKIIPGPAIFQERMAVMVFDKSPYQHLQELAGQPICFSMLAHTQFHLQAWFDAHHLSFIRMGFQEDGEMNDGYTVKYCAGLAGEATTLADTAHDGETASQMHRFLPESLAVYPVMATTSTSDGEWASIVAWSVDTLIRADAPASDWVLGGVDSLRIHAPELGLADGWQKKLIALVGTYSEIYDRNLGDKSPLHLPLGPNARVEDGGAAAAPYAD